MALDVRSHMPLERAWLKALLFVVFVSLWVGTVSLWFVQNWGNLKQMDVKGLEVLFMLVSVLFLVVISSLGFDKRIVNFWRLYWEKNIRRNNLYVYLSTSGVLVFDVGRRDFCAHEGALQWKCPLGGWGWNKSPKLFRGHSYVEWVDTYWEIRPLGWWNAVEDITHKDAEVLVKDKDGRVLVVPIGEALAYIIDLDNDHRGWSHVYREWKAFQADLFQRDMTIRTLGSLVEVFMNRLGPGGTFHRFAGSPSGKALLLDMDTQLRTAWPEYAERKNREGQFSEHP
jgi:hypothetical protein